MSLIYGYNCEKDDDNTSYGSGNTSNLEKLVGGKTDDRTKDSAFGRIKKNKEDISSSIISTTNVIASVVTSLGQKTDFKTVDSAFGRIKKNKKAIIASDSFAGSLSSLEGESSLKGTQLSHASAIAAHAGNLLILEDSVGTKTDPKTAETAFGRIRRNQENLSFANSFVGSSNSAEGSPSLKGAQLSLMLVRYRLRLVIY